MEIGDIYYASWGYDQTNIDFVVVVEISKTGKSVICRRVGQKVVKSKNPDGTPMFLSEYVAPSQPVGGTFRLKVKSYNGEAYLRGSYPFCRDETAKRLGSLFRYNGKPIFQSHWH